MGTSAVDRSYWPDKATAYAVVDALFEAPYNLPNTTVFVEEVATDHLYVDDDPNGDAIPAMSIQTAVNFVAAGKTIFVEVGIFNERVTVTKSLTIDGNLHSTAITTKRTINQPYCSVGMIAKIYYMGNFKSFCRT